MPKIRNQRGQSLLEVVIALVVIVIIVGALTLATIASIRNAQAAKNLAQGTKYAQEGLERVRAGRDRNQCITIVGKNINSWNGGNINCIGSDSIWQSLSSVSVDCEKEQLNVSERCYFNVSTDGALQNGSRYGVFPKDQAEKIPPTNMFLRAVILSDDLDNNNNFGNDNPLNAKKATSIVTWTDFSGTHESRLTTILRKL